MLRLKHEIIKTLLFMKLEIYVNNEVIREAI
jgi:hypothetical protein